MFTQELKICIPSGDRDLIPLRANPSDAGLDIKANEDIIVSPHTRKLISTGIHVELPINSYGQVAPRSGLACKGIDIGAGVIDRDYRGEVKILLINNGMDDFIIKKYMKIAQLIIIPVLNDWNIPTFIHFNDVDKCLIPSNRGTHGFGSTGV